MPDPPPPPPTPGLSPPAGERASAPALLPGRPSLGPGRSETTMPPPLPPPPLGVASREPASSGPPRPVPRAPRPELKRPDPAVSDGGGGTILPALRVPLPLAPPLVAALSRPVPDPGTDGGGGTTEAPGELPFAPPSVAGPAPMAAPATEGGGGTMLVAEELTMPPGAPRLVAELLFPPTLGGGGTTSVVPINLPSRLLMKPPPATCAGGGITAFEGSGKPPLASECRSRESW